MNVSLGGNLWDYLPEQRLGGIEHRQKTPRHQPSHPVDVIPGSRLAAITGAFTLQVNSAHVQGLKQPAPGLAISALAADGLIEAVEKPGPVFFLGVQWHPEALSPPGRLFQQNFRGFCGGVPEPG